MGTVPSFPFALAMTSYHNTGVGSSNHAAHGRLAQATSLTAMQFFMGSFSAMFMSRSVSLFGWMLAGTSFRAAPDQKSSPDPEVSVQDPGREATKEGSG